MTQRVLFLCTGNSCRSQMAEGWARHLHSDALEPHSAGIAVGRLDSRAVRVMREAGVDISSQRSKHVDELSAIAFDLVITVCDHANARCPRYPEPTEIRHVRFDDPPRLAANASSPQEAPQHYRRVRDEIREFVTRISETGEAGTRRIVTDD